MPPASGGGSVDNNTILQGAYNTVLQSILNLQSALQNFSAILRGAAYDGPVYVADNFYSLIFTVTDIQTTPVPAQYGAGVFISPNDVFYSILEDGSSSIYVLDWGALSQLLQFDTANAITTGTAVSAVGAVGSGAGQLSQPGRVILDRSGNIFVADSGNNRIQWIDPKNNWTSLYGPGTSGPTAPYLNAPCGLAMDLTGALIVADTNNHRLVRIANPTSNAPNWQPGGTSFQYPGSVAVGQDGSIYVVDWYQSVVGSSGGSAIQGTSPTRLIKMTDMAGSNFTVNTSVTNSAYAVAVGAQGLIYVTQGASILVFKNIGEQPSVFNVPGAGALKGISVPILSKFPFPF